MKHKIAVIDKATGCKLKEIRRTLWAESIGNFNPVFCRFRGKRTLVQSKCGDLSDPFRRDESYLDILYIEVGEDDNGSKQN